MQISVVQKDRSKIELDDPAMLRHWSKILGATHEEIATAVAKVGTCADTVRKELVRCAEKSKQAK